MQLMLIRYNYHVINSFKVFEYVINLKNIYISYNKNLEEKRSTRSFKRQV